MSRNAVDRLGERLRESPSADDVVQYASYRESFDAPLSDVERSIANLEIGASAGQRLKRIESVIAKLQRLPTMKLSQMQDIAGCRLIVEDIAEQDMACNRLQSHLDIRRVHDRRENPSAGYRAVHLIVRHDTARVPVEIQVRTRNQHLWACISEFAARVERDVKYGGGESGLREKLDLLSRKLWEFDQSGFVVPIGTSDDTMEHLLSELDSYPRREMNVVLARIRLPGR